MNRFDEADLRDALRRKEPPPGFAERVLRRAGREAALPGPRPGPGGPRLTGPRWLAWAAAAAIVLAAAGGVRYYAAQQERVAGEAAKAQVMLALQIAGSKLQMVQARVRGAGDERAPVPDRRGSGS